MMEEFFDAEFDTMPWDDLLSWQYQLLPDYLSKLTKRSPFYEVHYEGYDLDNIFDPLHWSRLPFTTKDLLRRSQQEARSLTRLGDIQGVSDDEINRVLSSSGTTGLPVIFGLTKNDRDAWEHSIANMWFTAGIRHNSVVALTTGMPMVAGGLTFADGIQRTGANLVWLGGQTPERMVSTLEQLKVDVLIGTVSFLTFFAERVEKILGVPATNLAVRTVIGGGEPGTGQPDIRAKIKSAWAADRVSEIMGICDVMAGLWAECPEGQGMHFTGGRNVLVELIDPNTELPVAWEEGVQAEAVYTTFTREATPVIRFRSRDHMHVVATKCPCGRTSPVVRCIGRTDDMLIYKAMNVFPSAIRDTVLQVLPKYLAGPLRIRKSYATQVSFDDPIPVEIELSSPIEDAEAAILKQTIEKAVKNQLRVRIVVEFLASGSIPLSDYKNTLTYTKEIT